MILIQLHSKRIHWVDCSLGGLSGFHSRNDHPRQTTIARWPFAHLFISRVIQVSLMGDSCAPELPSSSRHWDNYVDQSRPNYICVLSNLFITAFRRLACAIICLASHGSYLGNGIFLTAKCDTSVCIFTDLFYKIRVVVSPFKLRS